MTADPRDLGRLFGGIRRGAPGKLRVGLGRCETDLRRNLASAAHAYGWLVEEEVVVPWGRIDIVLRDGDGAPALIELKLDLAKRAKIRRAFQQIDGYGRLWAQEYSEAADTILVGQRVDEAGMAAMQCVYPSVGWCNAGGLLAELVNRGTDRGRLLRRQRCVERLADLRGALGAYESALQSLPADQGDNTVFDVFQMFDEIWLGGEVRS